MSRLRETGKTMICGKEYTFEELKRGIRNPFYEKLIKEVVVPIRRDDYEVFEEIAKINEEPVEALLKRCLKWAAKEFQKED